LFCACLLSLLAGVNAQASERLWQLIGARDAAAGAFLQELYDEEDELLERATGHYAVLRPQYFRWEIDYPDRQRIVVAGDTLWHYDVDLATATRRNTAGSDEFAPLQLLGGEVAELQQRFSVTDLGDDRYRLQPNYPDAGFASVEMGWEDGQLTAMTVLDRSGQRLELSLTPERPAPALSPADFRFSPPEGVEVYGDGR
jgi:chaperone LolA